MQPPYYTMNHFRHTHTHSAYIKCLYIKREENKNKINKSFGSNRPTNTDIHAITIHTRTLEHSQKRVSFKTGTTNAQITNIVIVYNYIIFFYCNWFLLGYSFSFVSFNILGGCLLSSVCFVIVWYFEWRSFPFLLCMQNSVCFSILSRYCYAEIIVLNLVSIYAAVTNIAVVRDCEQRDAKRKCCTAVCSAFNNLV